MPDALHIQRGLERRRKGQLGQLRSSPEDHLPPHSDEAEQGTLGCIVLSPEECIPKVGRLVGPEGPHFYADHHRIIWQEMWRMHEAGIAVDLLTLPQRLKDRGELGKVGGMAYLVELDKQTPSAANLAYYLDILREKYAMRRIVQSALDVMQRARTGGGTVDGLIDTWENDLAGVQRVARDPAEVGRRLKSPSDFMDEYWASWFGGKAGEPGHRLPEAAFGDFPFRIRERELTFVLGEKGAGKTSLISYIVLHLMQQGMKAAIASMEMHPADTLKILAAQLLGTTVLPNNSYGQARAKAAFEWLRSRVRIYDFLGIAPWRELLDEMETAAADGYNLFTVDSVMRLGILDDDYAEQGLCASRMAQFCMESNAHTFLINHLNKGDRSRGSQQWIDNSHNVVAIRRNEKRAELMHNLLTERDAGQISQEDFLQEVKALNQSEKTSWMSKFELRNQRWSGSQQNASRYLLFERESLQLYDRRWNNPKVDWLSQWDKKEASGGKGQGPFTPVGTEGVPA